MPPDLPPPPLHRERVRRRLAHADWEALLPYLLLGALLAVAVVVQGRDIRHHLDAFEDWVAARGAWGAGAFVVLFVVATSLLFPESVLSIAGRSGRAVILHDVMVFAGLAACLVAVVAVSRVARRAVISAVAEAEAGPADGPAA